VLWLIFFFLFFSQTTLATENVEDNNHNECEVVLNPDKPLLAQFLRVANKEIQENKKTKTISLSQARFSIADSIARKKKVPNTLQIPSIISKLATFKEKFASLSDEQQAKIRKELLKSAMSSHKDARNAILEKLGETLIKQFKKDYTLPSFSKLAEVVDSTAVELTELLYGESHSEDGKETTAKKGYQLLIEEIQRKHADAFEEVKANFIQIYSVKARASWRTLTLKQFYSAIILKKPGIDRHFSENHLAYLLGEELPIKGHRIQKPYIQLFESLESLYNQARQLKPDSFDKVWDSYQINEESHDVIVQMLKDKDRVILTSAAPGVEVHEEAFVALTKFAEKMDAFIVVFAEAGQPMRLDPLLVNHPLVHIVHDSIEISPWLKINTLPLPFKRQDANSPLRLPGRGGQRGQTHIIGHPQLRDELIPTIDNHLFPHRIVTTGAISKGWYSGRRPISGVTDDGARDVHIIGAVLLEKDNQESGLDGLGTPNTWHIRQIEWSEHSKSLLDNGTSYSFRPEQKLKRFKPIPKNEYEARLKEENIEEHLDASEKHNRLISAYQAKELIETPVRPEYLVFGDEHVGGEDNYSFFQNKINAIKKYRPKRIVLHDLFDGKSINHWESQNLLIMAKKAANNELNLKAELDKVVAYVNFLLNMDSELGIIIVESNHNNWLTRLLREAEKLSQPINDPLVYELIHSALNMDIDPLEYYMTRRAEKVLADPDRKFREGYLTQLIDDTRVQFLPKGTSLKVGPADVSIEVGEHGHNSGGFRGGGISMRTTAGRSYSAIVNGHTHSPGRNGRAGNVGASIFRPDYGIAGASATGMAFGTIYADGIFQVYIYNPHSQSYELGEGKPLPANEFFYSFDGEEWPRVIQHEEKGKGLDTLDQWRGVSVTGE
ncbi:MAG: hypothetical protein KDD40_07400, partial [Bdellovibrionales bacterium]|nr:hypothetical protein [Bdellovibrionales bacterium]